MAQLTRDDLKKLFLNAIKDGGFDLKEYIEEQSKAHRDEIDARFEKQRTDWMGAVMRGGKTPEDEKKEKGLVAARLVKLLAAGKGDPARALSLAKEHYGEDATVYKALAAGEATAGGFLVAPEFSSEVIELLRPASVVRSLNPITLPMENGVLEVPKLTGGATASYTGENQNITSTQQTTGMLELIWKKLAALVPISNDLLRFSSVNADMVVRDDIVAAMAQREDQAFIRDDGTANTPKGLRFQALAAQVTASAPVAPLLPTLAEVTTELSNMVLDLLNANTRMLRPGWIFAPRTHQFLMSQRDGNGNFAWRPEMLSGNLHGWPFRITTQVPVNLGGGADESEIYLVDFADAVIGESDEVVIDASPNAAYFDSTSAAVVSAFSRDQSVIRAIARHDFGMRHDESISILSAVRWGG